MFEFCLGNRNSVWVLPRLPTLMSNPGKLQLYVSTCSESTSAILRKTNWTHEKSIYKLNTSWIRYDKYWKSLNFSLKLLKILRNVLPRNNVEDPGISLWNVLENLESDSWFSLRTLSNRHISSSKSVKPCLTISYFLA